MQTNTNITTKYYTTSKPTIQVTESLTYQRWTVFCYVIITGLKTTQ